jgi:hypothetical protein
MKHIANIKIEKTDRCLDCQNHDKSDNSPKCKLCIVADYPERHPDRVKTEKECENGNK